MTSTQQKSSRRVPSISKQSQFTVAPKATKSNIGVHIERFSYQTVVECKLILHRGLACTHQIFARLRIITKCACGCYVDAVLDFITSRKQKLELRSRSFQIPTTIRNTSNLPSLLRKKRNKISSTISRQASAIKIIL